MTNPLISVIVPVYNVEKYLDRCVQSLLNQTYKNIEIILVDDGSSDNCPEMCDEYAKKNNNIKVVHKLNGGLSSARNAGMKVADGEYIGFVDSDDWVAHDMYEYLLCIIHKYNADISQIGYTFAYSYDEKVKELSEEIKILHGKDILQYYMFISTVASGGYVVWRCLFSAYIVKAISFREGKISEDIDFKYKALSMCDTAVFSNQIKYFYFQSIGSITTSGLRQKDFDLYDAVEELCKLTQAEDYGSIRKLVEIKKARTAFSLLSKIAYYGISDASIDKKTVVKQLKKEHRKNVKTLLFSPIPMSRKVLSVMFAFSYTLSETVVRLAKRKNLI